MKGKGKVKGKPSNPVQGNIDDIMNAFGDDKMDSGFDNFEKNFNPEKDFDMPIYNNIDSQFDSFSKMLGGGGDDLDLTKEKQNNKETEENSGKNDLNIKPVNALRSNLENSGQLFSEKRNNFGNNRYNYINYNAYSVYDPLNSYSNIEVKSGVNPHLEYFKKGLTHRKFYGSSRKNKFYSDKLDDIFLRTYTQTKHNLSRSKYDTKIPYYFNSNEMNLKDYLREKRNFFSCITNLTNNISDVNKNSAKKQIENYIDLNRLSYSNSGGKNKGKFDFLDGKKSSNYVRENDKTYRIQLNFDGFGPCNSYSLDNFDNLMNKTFNKRPKSLNGMSYNFSPGKIGKKFSYFLIKPPNHIKILYPKDRRIAYIIGQLENKINDPLYVRDREPHNTKFQKYNSLFTQHN